MPIEPKRLTPDELAGLLSLIESDIRLYPHEMKRLHAHIAALEAELAAAEKVQECADKLHMAARIYVGQPSEQNQYDIYGALTAYTEAKEQP